MCLRLHDFSNNVKCYLVLQLSGVVSFVGCAFEFPMCNSFVKKLKSVIFKFVPKAY